MNDTANEPSGPGTAAPPAPTELRLRRGGASLLLTWNDGAQHEVAAELLRVLTPSAEARGHSPAQRKVVDRSMGVIIRAVEPVGRYAARLVFSDGHDTGLFPWALLRRAGEAGEALWAAHLAELAAAGLVRRAP